MDIALKFSLPIYASANSSNSAEGSDPGDTTNSPGVYTYVSFLKIALNEKGFPLLEEIYSDEHTKSFNAVCSLSGLNV